MRAAAFGLAIAVWVGAAGAAEPARFETVIRNHRFEPAELRAPANTPIVIAVTNADPTAEEFESQAMGVEKVIPGGRSLQVRIRPLDPGRYTFMGEYYSDTAQGVVIVEAEK